MNSKKILASVLSLAFVAAAFTSCGNSGTPGSKNDKQLEKSPDAVTIFDKEKYTTAADVTAITAGVDKDGKIVDKEGITDISGHKVYATGEKDNKGLPIYTTGKKASNGNIIYTKNTKDSFGNQIYYTGKYDENGKLVLYATTEVPDYTSNETPKKSKNVTTTTTTTVGYKSTSNKVIKDAKDEYTKYFGGTGMDFNRGVTACKDGGYAAICYSTSYNGSFEGLGKDVAGHAAVVKYDADGNMLWRYITGGNNEITPEGVAELKDGSIIMVGSTGASDTDAPKHSKTISSLVVKLSKTGEVVWTYSFPGDENQQGDAAISVAATPDGGFVVGGYAKSSAGLFNGTDGNAAYLFKFDKNCNVKWRKTLSGSKSNIFQDVSVADNGDIYATCVTTSDDGDFAMLIKGKSLTKNTVLMKFDKNGNLKWSKNLDGTGNSELKAVVATDDGCAVAGSYTVYKRADGIYRTVYGKSDGYIIRYDKDGNVCWATNLGGTDADYIHSITKVEGGFAVAGTTKSVDYIFQNYKHGGEEDAFVLFISEQGETGPVILLDGTKADSILALDTLDDGSVIAAGWTQSNDNAYQGSNAGSQYMGTVTKCKVITEAADK